jgi:hypothetical protein
MRYHGIVHERGGGRGLDSISQLKFTNDDVQGVSKKGNRTSARYCI